MGGRNGGDYLPRSAHTHAHIATTHTHTTTIIAIELLYDVYVHV